MTQVLYVELKGGNAVTELRSLLHEWGAMADFRGGEVLVSPAQPGLALLQGRWAADPPLVKLEGARSWVFVVVESADGPSEVGA